MNNQPLPAGSEPNVPLPSNIPKTVDPLPSSNKTLSPSANVPLSPSTNTPLPPSANQYGTFNPDNSKSLLPDVEPGHLPPDNEVVKEDTYLEKLYKFIDPHLGETYFAIALLSVGVLMTYFLSFINVGWVIALIMAYGLASVYEQSLIAAYKRKVQKISDRLMIPELETDIESSNWINQFLNQFWIQFEPHLSSQIISNVESVVQPLLPSFIPSLTFTRFTLGNKPPVIEGIKHYIRDDPDIVLMDWMISFTPYPDHITIPSTNSQKVDGLIKLNIECKLGPVKFNIPVRASKFRIKFNARVKLHLMNQFPHVRKVDVSLLEFPEYDFALRPIDWLFGLDVTNIPGFHALVKRQVSLVLSSMVLAPKVYSVDLEKSMAANSESESAIGVLILTLSNARNLKNIELLGTIDPFVSVNIEDRNELWRSKTKDNTTSPVWDETTTLLIYNLSETLNLVIKDENGVKKDANLGLSSFSMASLASDPNQDLCEKVIRNGKERGEITFRASYYPVIVGEGKGEDDEVIESNSGIFKVQVRQIQGLEQQKKILPVGSKNKVWVDIKLNGFIKFSTPHSKPTNNLVVESSYEQFVESLSNTNITVALRSSDSNSALGEANMSLEKFCEMMRNNEYWLEMIPASSGKLAVRVKVDGHWSPIIIDNSHGVLPPPIGFVRAIVRRGKDITGKDTSRSGPFVSVVMSNKVWGRTEQVDPSPNPRWDETFYVPIHRNKETLRFEVRGRHGGDEEKAKNLGSAEVSLASLVGPPLPDKNGFRDGDLKDKWHDLCLKKEKKGELQLELQYFSLAKVSLPEKSDSGTMLHARNASQATFSTKGRTSVDLRTSPTRTSISSAKNSPIISPRGELVDSDPESISKPEEIIEKIPLSQYPSGVLRVTVHAAENVGTTRSKLSCEVTINRNTRSPILKTLMIKHNTNPAWGEVGEGFIKEISVDKVMVVINDHKDKIKQVGNLTLKVSQILEGLEKQSDGDNNNEGTWYNLASSLGKVRLSFIFSPAEYLISEAESAKNMGVLQIRVIGANDLLGVDSDGFSDPYVTLSLNGGKPLQTKVKKNTLSPTYDQLFNLLIKDRINAIVRVEVFDWNQIHSHKSLGYVDLELGGLEVETSVRDAFQLINVNTGMVELDLMFAPEYVLYDTDPSLLEAVRLGNPVDLVAGLAKGGFMVASGGLNLAKGTGKMAFGGAKTLATGTGKLALGGATTLATGTSKFAMGGAKLAGEGVKTMFTAPVKLASSGAGLAKGIFGSKKEHHEDQTISDNEINTNPLIRLRETGPNGSTHSLRTPPDVSTVTSTLPTITTTYDLKITVIEAKDLKAVDRNGHADPYIKIFNGKKQEHKTKILKKTRNPFWNESFVIPNLDPTHPLIMEWHLKDYNMFKENVDLGTYWLDVWSVLGQELKREYWTEPGMLVNGGVGKLHFKIEAILPSGTSPIIQPPTAATNGSSLQPPGSPERQITPSNSRMTEDYTYSDSDGDEFSDGTVNMRRRSMASLKPSSLLGSLRKKISKN